MAWLTKLPLTLVLIAICCVLYWGPFPPTAFYLQTQPLNIPSLISGHFMHSDLNHFTFNVIALGVLASIIELQSRRLLVMCLAAGILSVNTLLLSPLASISLYCGLSGVLNSLFVSAVLLLWRQQHNPLLLMSLFGALLKPLVEIQLNQALFSSTHWPPYPPAHLAGLFGGTVVALHYFSRKADASSMTPPNRGLQHVR